ncbi:MAG TPA: hypothetical protein VF482_18780 [Trebonia sp.]
MSRGDILVRGGYLLTMDQAGDVPDGDVHISGGEIRAVGRGLDAPGAEVIDAAGMIVAPGLVDTHWHLWNTLLRGLSDGAPGGAANSPDRSGYFVTCVRLGRRFLPSDTYAGTRLACAEAIDAGITTVHDWAHNIRGREWAEAGLRALAESGLRARFSYGYETGHPNDQVMALDDLAHVHDTWPAYSAGGRIHLTPGKRADLIAVSVNAWNLGVLTNPARLLVTAAHPGNVHTVIADGRILKRGDALTGYDVAEVTRSARSALAGVLARA